MDINLNTITEKGILLNQEIIFDDEKYSSALIKKVNDCFIKGKIYYSTTKEVLLEANIKGNIVIVDSNTCNDILYPFNVDINEILQEDSTLEENLRTNSKEMLDLREVLWQNIVLEVPLNFSELDKPELTEGNGWKLINEDEVIDPRMQIFKDLL